MKTTVIVLIVLGVLLISGITYARYQGFCKGPEGRADWVVKRISNGLELDDTQQQQLVLLRDRVMELGGELRSERPKHVEQALQLLEPSRLDRDEAKRLFAEKQAWLAAVGPNLIDAFADFSDSLSDDQRARLREMIVQHRERHHGGHCCGNRPAYQE